MKACKNPKYYFKSFVTQVLPAFELSSKVTSNLSHQPLRKSSSSYLFVRAATNNEWLAKGVEAWNPKKESPCLILYKNLHPVITTKNPLLC